METPVQTNEALKSQISEPAMQKDSSVPSLPPLSPQEFRAYNHMAEHMDMFHSNFRRTWTILSTACTTSQKPPNLSLRGFLNLITQFTHHLTIHHTIEEQHIFPVLATKMPFFGPSSAAIQDHEKIHEGVEALEQWVDKVSSGEKELRWTDLKDIMDGFGEVLWRHLDEEVEMLGAENMRKYWTQEEMRVMPM